MARNHRVRQGECIASIAKLYHFPDYRTIWNHARNVRLKRRRPNPNILYPGDRVYIPDITERDESRGTGALHRFEVPLYEVRLRLVIRNRAREPYAGKRYELRVRDDATHSGTTAANGLIEETVPADAEAATLRVWLEDATVGPDPFECRLMVGHLDPVETNYGVQARLNNLAFPCGGVDGVVGTLTRGALTSFQTAEELEPTGRADPPTRERLTQRHDVL